MKTGKGLQTLLRAFAQLPHDALLLLVGEGHLQKEILQFAASHNLRDRVRLVGVVAHDDLPAYYRLMDVCVLPSETMSRWKESFGRVLVEAMACGVPVIGSNSGAIPETVGNAGRIFPEKDDRMLAREIMRVLQNERLRRQLRQAGLARAQEFSWENVAEKNWQAYQACVG